MTVLDSGVDPRSPAFGANRARMAALVQELRQLVDQVRLGGGEASRKRHTGRGKLLPRDRVRTLIDPGSPFPGACRSSRRTACTVAISPPPASSPASAASAAASASWWRTTRRVKGGTYFPMTVKKHLRAQEIAQQNRLPCVYLVDSGGANLPNQDEVFPDRDHFGAYLLQSGAHVRRGYPAGRRRDGELHRRRRLCAGDVGSERDRAQPGHHLPGRVRRWCAPRRARW